MKRTHNFLLGSVLGMIVLSANLHAQDAPVANGPAAGSAALESQATGAEAAKADEGHVEQGADHDKAAAPQAAEPEVAVDAASGTEAHQAGADGTSQNPQNLKTADESYDIKIRGMEEKVNELKEKIFRSKARLLALQEMVFTGVSTGARAVIVHRNEMGSSFRLREMHYFIDGAPLKQEVDESGDGLNAKQEIQLFSGNIVPGNHQITVNLTYQGHGFGVFSYLNGYTFHIKSSYTFKAQDGKETLVKVVAYEKGGFTTELKDRPAVRYDVEVKKNQKRTNSDKAKQAETGQ